MDERLYSPQEQTIDKDDHPQFINWANALMNIVDYDKDTKEMTVEYVRDFTYSPLTVVITTYY